MDLSRAEQRVADEVAAAAVVVPVGAGTHREVGGTAEPGTEVRAPTGVVAYDPAELTVTVGAGTSVGDLAATLAEAGQECPLDPRDDRATLGGTLATGLSGHRRLRYGPLRDRVLEVRYASAEGRLVRGGGPTVKNVTGYDMPRLLVGSFGTLGVLTRVILRCQPRPEVARWAASVEEPASVHERSFRPSTLLWDGTHTHALFEGDPHDVDAELRAAGLEPAVAPPAWPSGPHRGRASAPPVRLGALGRALAELGGVRWLAEWGVGTVHVAADTEEALLEARGVTEQSGGWLLREAGAPGIDGFGRAMPNAALMARVKAVFDPTGKLNPGRLPIVTGPTPGRDEIDVVRA